MNNQTIADSAIYQHTAYMAEKYKAQRDELLTALIYVRERVESGNEIAMSRVNAAINLTRANP